MSLKKIKNYVLRLKTLSNAGSLRGQVAHLLSKKSSQDQHFKNFRGGLTARNMDTRVIKPVG
ncbi:MAG TPA: hypothetical protein VN963_06445, partial [bacterium]|nr:hypothetical protein [bacterium]